MNDLENRLEHASSGEFRLNPDEQRLYLNTYRERVLVAITLSDATNLLFKAQFNTILNTYDSQDYPIYIKICGSLSDELSSFYLKLAIQHHFDGQILSEKTDQHYGIIIHTDTPVNLEKIELSERFPNITLTEPSQPTEKKKSLFSKLFG